MENSIMKKSVYLVWTNRSNLGDLINGTLTTFKICKKNNYNLIIDMSNNNISNFLKNGKSPLCIFPHLDFEHISYNAEEIPFFDLKDKNNLEIYIQEFFSTSQISTANVCYVRTSAIPFEEIREDEKKLIKDLLFPNDLIYNLIEFQYSALPPVFLEAGESLKKYASVYYNVGDEKGIKDNARHHLFCFYLNQLSVKSKMLNENGAIVLFSDSYEFKKFAESENRNLAFTNNKLNNEICDFYLLSKSKSITFLYDKSLYDAEKAECMPYSHFVELCSKIYDLPLHVISI